MITVHFYRQDQDGPIVAEVVDRIVLRRKPARRYWEVGQVKIDYTHRPHPDHPEDSHRDALTYALESRTAFRAEEFLDRVVVNLAHAGLNDIANTVAKALRSEIKGAGVILFDLKDIDRCASD